MSDGVSCMGVNPWYSPKASYRSSSSTPCRVGSSGCAWSIAPASVAVSKSTSTSDVGVVFQVSPIDVMHLTLSSGFSTIFSQSNNTL